MEIFAQNPDDFFAIHQINACQFTLGTCHCGRIETVSSLEIIRYYFGKTFIDVLMCHCEHAFLSIFFEYSLFCC